MRGMAHKSRGGDYEGWSRRKYRFEPIEIMVRDSDIKGKVNTDVVCIDRCDVQCEAAVGSSRWSDSEINETSHPTTDEW